MVNNDALISLASLMTTFDDCRTRRGIGACNECLLETCTIKHLHYEFKGLLDSNPDIANENPRVILKPYLPERVIRHLGY